MNQNPLKKTELAESVAYCGLVCRLCFLANACDGCKAVDNRCERDRSDEGCAQKKCCQAKSLSGCWECPTLASCEVGIYGQGKFSKVKAFALCIQGDGLDRFIDGMIGCIQRGLNPEKGKDLDNRTVTETMSLIRRTTADQKKDIYDDCPHYRGTWIYLRPIRKSDACDLLSCYSDERALPFFNSDNCKGDDFHYRNLERMSEAIAFWADAYRARCFVRWAIIDNSSANAVGTVEMLRRKSDDEFNNFGLLRIDLRSTHERREVITDILRIAKRYFHEAFDADRILTKAIPAADERCASLRAEGFVSLGRPILGFGDYYLLERNFETRRKHLP